MHDMELYARYYRHADGCILVVRNTEGSVEEASKAFHRTVGVGFHSRWSRMRDGSVPLLILVVSHYFHNWERFKDSASNRYTAQEVDTILDVPSAGTGIEYHVQMVDMDGGLWNRTDTVLHGLCLGFRWLFDRMNGKTSSKESIPQWLTSMEKRLSVLQETCPSSTRE